MISIINFPFCNYHSVVRYFIQKNIDYVEVNGYKNFNKNDFVILPGVGTFEEGAKFLRMTGLDNSIKKHANSGGPLLGICLGMQLLLTQSEESPGIIGLDIIPGDCKKLRNTQKFRLPHLGWNSLEISNKHHSFSNLEDANKSKCDFYFVHSYYCKPDNRAYTIASFSHPDGEIPAVIAKDNTIGCQFHPEKSGDCGYQFLDNIIN